MDESARDQKTPELRLGALPGQSCLLCAFPLSVACVEPLRAEDKTQLVSDVHAFPGHIACDAASRSEVVVPLHYGDRVVGVLDIDSPLLDRFSAYDARGLESFVRALENCICWNAC